MTRAKRQPAVQDRDALMALMPPGALRVKVETEKGDVIYKDIPDLADSDFIQTRQDGLPIVMMGKPGRKHTPEVNPANPLIGEIIRRKKAHIEDDPILATAKTSPDSPDVLNQVILSLGEEVSSLGFERLEAERDGKDTTHVSVKRIQGLKALADTWLKRKDQLVTREIDLRSPGFQAVSRFYAETLKEAMASSGLRPEMIETVFAKAGAMMTQEKWENEAKARMKNA